MTAPTLTDDFLFDLDLQFVEVEASREIPLSPHASGGSAAPDCISGCGSIRPCPWTSGCTYVTCTRCI